MDMIRTIAILYLFYLHLEKRRYDLDNPNGKDLDNVRDNHHVKLNGVKGLALVDILALVPYKARAELKKYLISSIKQLIDAEVTIISIHKYFTKDT